jgi:hypothetical protein
MSTTDPDQSPFTRPRFVLAALVVGLVVVLAVVVGIVRATGHDNKDASPGPSASAAAPTAAGTPSSSAHGSDASACGLPGVVLTGTISAAPAAEWAYQGTTAYPTSPKYGPGATDSSGVHYCFQHSPQGALFAAANVLVQTMDRTMVVAVIERFAPAGSYRDKLLADVPTAAPPTGVRITLGGFRLLAYTGDTARVDIGTNISVNGTPSSGSYVYEFTWQDGDWKYNPKPTQSSGYTALPNLAGYVPWGK